MSLMNFIRNASPMIDYALGVGIVGAMIIGGSYLQAFKDEGEVRKIINTPYKEVSRESDGRLRTRFENGKVFYSLPEDKRIAQSK